MPAGVSDGALNELVVAVESADDPTLYRRACSALGALLAEHDDDANEVNCSTAIIFHR